MSINNKNLQELINQYGDFQLASFIYMTINELMKSSLDLGTLLSNDKQKLRAYKEQIKASHREAWNNIAHVFVDLEIIERCTCELNDFCEICKGSRFIPASSLNAPIVRENVTFLAEGAGEELQSKLTQEVHGNALP